MPTLELQPQSKEPPLIADVHNYWKHKRGTRPFPRRQDIVPAEIKKWLPYILLADVIDGGADFRYRLVGSRLHSFFPAVPTGKVMSEALAPFGEDTVRKTLDTYGAVLTLGEPLRVKGDGAWYDQPPKYFEAILTPLSDDGITVNMIFGAFDFMWNFADMNDEPVDEVIWETAVEALR